MLAGDISGFIRNIGQVVDTVGTEHCGICRTHGCEKAKTENVGCKPQFTTK